MSMMANFEALLAAGQTATWERLQPKPASTAEQIEEFVHELGGKIDRLIFGEDYAGLGDFKPKEAGRKAMKLFADALVRSAVIECPVVRLLCVGGVLARHDSFVDCFERNSVRLRFETFGHFEASEGTADLLTSDDLRPPGNAEVAWTAVKTAAAAFAAHVAGKKNSEIPRFQRTKRAAMMFSGAVQQLIDAEGACLLLSFPRAIKVRNEEGVEVEEVVTSAPDLEAELKKFYETSGRNADFDKGRARPLFQADAPAAGAPEPEGDGSLRFLADLNFKDALKYAGGQFQRKMERVIERGGGTFSVIRHPIYDTYAQTSLACKDLEDPLAVLAIHHGIFRSMENIRMLPPCGWDDDALELCEVVKKALSAYAEVLRAARAKPKPFPKKVGKFLKTFLVDQMTQGGAYSYIHTAMTGEGTIEGVDVAKLAKDFMQETGLQVSDAGGGLELGGAAASTADTGGGEDDDGASESGPESDPEPQDETDSAEDWEEHSESGDDCEEESDDDCEEEPDDNGDVEIGGEDDQEEQGRTENADRALKKARN